MSTTRPSREPPARTAGQAPRRPLAEVRERRRRGRSGRRAARLDLGLGVLAAIVLVLATPGLAISGLIALLVLVVCGLSFLISRRRARRAEHAGPRRSARAAGSAEVPRRRPRNGAARDPRRSGR